MQKNVASQKLIVFAFDATTNQPATGDAANLTAYVSKDYGSVTVLTDTSATEMDATNAKGYYLFDLAQAETNADTLLFSAKSSTSNIVVIAVPATVFTVPASFNSLTIANNATAANVTRIAGAAVSTSTAQLGVNVVNLGGTAQTARDIGASVLLSSGTGTGQLKLASGYVAMTWADIAAPTTTVNLSGTTIATTQKVDVNTIKTNAVVNAGTITFPTGATLASTTNITAGTIATVTNLTNAPTSGDFTATMKTSIGTAVAASAVASVTGNVGGNVTGSVGSVVGAVGSVTGAVGSVTGAVGSVTGNVGGNVTGSVGSVVGLTASNLDATISSRASATNLATVAGYIDTEITDIQNRLPASLSGGLMQASIQATGNAVIGGFSFENDAFDGLYFGTTGNNAIVAAFGTGSSLTALGTAAELAKVPKSDSNVTWNATAAAQIQTEANDALVANNLDHLMLSAVDTDFATTVHLNSVIGHLADNGTSATFDRATDSMEAQRDNVGTAGAGLTAADDATLSAIAALNNITAASVWAVGTRTLTAGTNIDGSTFTGIPWNAAWDAEVQSEVADALAVYDPPTNAEMEARTLASASYATAASIAALNNLSAAQVTAAVPTAAQNAAAILAAGDVDGFTVEETLKLCLAILAGKLSGAATTAVAIRAADDSKARVTATVDASGNRSAVTLDAAG